MSQTPAAGAAPKKAASALALRAKIAQARNAAPDQEDVPVPELGADVVFQMRSMSFEERTRVVEEGFHDDAGERPKLNVFQPMVVLFTAHDPESGQRLFEDTEEDWAFVRGLPAAVVDRLSKVGLRVSKMSKEATEAAKNGSGSMASATPSSPSPASSASSTSTT